MIELPFTKMLEILGKTYKSIDWRFATFKLGETSYCIQSVMRFTRENLEEVKRVHDSLQGMLGESRSGDLSIHLKALPFSNWHEIHDQLSNGIIKEPMGDIRLVGSLDFGKVFKSSGLIPELKDADFPKKEDFFTDIGLNNGLDKAIKGLNTWSVGFPSVQIFIQSWFQADVYLAGSRFIFSLPLYASIIGRDLAQENSLTIKVKSNIHLLPLKLSTLLYN